MNDDEVTFNIFKTMREPIDFHVASTKDTIDEEVASASDLMRES